MTLEDPFYVVKDEVFKALNKTRGLYVRWQQAAAAEGAPHLAPDWSCTELRNALRSIQWDLEDLEDTICIVEKNSSKFKIDNKEISDRRSFIEATKQEVKMMKGAMSMRRHSDDTAHEPLLGATSPQRAPAPAPAAAAWPAPRYTQYARLASEPEGAADRLEALSASVGSLRTVSKQIGAELDEQAVMLDELNTELEHADSKLDSTIKKVAKVLHMNNDRRQWSAILILIVLLVIILILFIII